MAVRAGVVGGEQVPGQQTHGPAVGRDVVDGHGKDVFGGREGEQFGPDRDLGGQVKWLCLRLGHCPRQVDFGDMGDG